MSATSTHPIDPFLAAWEREVDRRALDLRLRVYRSLSRELVWTPTRLRATLRAILALDADERARFDVCFDGFFTEADTLPLEIDTVVLYRELRASLDLPVEASGASSPEPV